MKILHAFIFQTTSKGKSYFQAYKDYQKWEDFLQKVKDNITKYNPNSPLVDMFQTSDFWPEVESCICVVAVSFALYGQGKQRERMGRNICKKEKQNIVKTILARGNNISFRPLGFLDLPSGI